MLDFSFRHFLVITCEQVRNMAWQKRNQRSHAPFSHWHFSYAVPSTGKLFLLPSCASSSPSHHCHSLTWHNRHYVLLWHHGLLSSHSSLSYNFVLTGWLFSIYFPPYDYSSLWLGQCLFLLTITLSAPVVGWHKYLLNDWTHELRLALSQVILIEEQRINKPITWQSPH